jgi:hypothetical protein
LGAAITILDLFTSNRVVRWGVFRQDIRENMAEPLLTGREAVYVSRLSPDGAWVLHVEAVRTVRGQTPIYRLMRVPASGGMPQPVFEIEQNWVNYYCGRSPGRSCAILTMSSDAQQLSLTAFDPATGHRSLLRTIENDPSSADPAMPACWQFSAALSPDGSTFALARRGERDIQIRLLSLTGGPDREITVRDWPNVSGLDWASDGKGLYCGVMSAKGAALLFVDLRGKAQVVWQAPDVITERDYVAGIPSPDGLHLALWREVYDSNIWMARTF